MAAEWYYTTNKQQMGPVSWMDLRELAENGILKPHDLVWTEGMDEWVKAVQQRGLFADGGESGRRSAAKPPPGRRGRRPVDNEVEEEDEDDERTSRKKARKHAVERTKMATGLKVGLILGGGFLLLMFLGCGVVGLVWLSMRDDGGPAHHNFTIRNLPQQRSEERQFRFQQGRRVVITVTNTTQFPNTDVDLHVLRGVNGNDIIAVDERLPMQDRHCRLDVNIPATDTYRIRVVNLGPGMANSCVVNITVQ
jgi:hypothetical protein